MKNWALESTWPAQMVEFVTLGPRAVGLSPTLDEEIT